MTRAIEVIEVESEKKGSVLGLGGNPAPRDVRARSGRSETFAWRAAGWFGLLFLFIGLADMALVWYPLRSGNPTWEFGAIDLSFSSLPVLSVGFAVLLAASAALGRTRVLWVLALLGVLIALFCVGAYLLYLTDVPLALRNAPAEVLTGVKKSVVRTTIFGVGFATAYMAAAIATLRHLRSVKREGSLA